MRFLNFNRRTQVAVDWNSIKKTDKVYPSNSITIITTQTESGQPCTGWIDMGYVEYDYKKFCPFNLQFSIELGDNDKLNDSLDMGSIEDYFIDALKTGCVVHPVSRVVTDFGFIMDLYVDDSEFAAGILNKLYEDSNKLVEFGCGFNHDPKWKEYKRILKMIN